MKSLDASEVYFSPIHPMLPASCLGVSLHIWRVSTTHIIGTHYETRHKQKPNKHLCVTEECHDFFTILRLRLDVYPFISKLKRDSLSH